MTSERITSASNPLVKRARRLRTRKHRLAEGITLVEGTAAVWEAVEHADVDTILWSPDLLTGKEGRALVERASKSGARVVELSSEVFEALADRENPVGLAALAGFNQPELGSLDVHSDSLFVVLVDVASPGNLGTIVRTADAASARVIVVGTSTDPWHPGCVKASMGTVFSRPPAAGKHLDEVLAWSRSKNVSLITTSARATTEHWEMSPALPTALVLGSERHGLSDAALEAGELQVRIPMEGSASSLNLAVAAGILIFEVRERTRSG